MARTVGIGHQDFGQLIQNDYFYVDKTNFIKEWWERGDTVTLITRPRRFGKTLNMSMLELYKTKEKAMNNQYTLKVYPNGQGRDVYRVIEICGKDTLDQLCLSIINSFDFFHEHLYEFCMDNRMYSDYNYQSCPENGEPSTKIKLDKLHLCKGQKFSLHYDFGDDWMFTINVTKITEVETYHKPAIIKEKGTIEQYPDYDDEEWE